MMNIKYLALLLALPFMGSAQSRPNIVFLFADDLGYGELSYTSDSYDTPSIDSLCEMGAYFNNFYAKPVCSPARYTFLTGKHSFRGGFDYQVIRQFDGDGMKAEETTIAEVMKSEGYATGFFGKWHVGSSSPEYTGYVNGFDYFWGSLQGFRSMKTSINKGVWVRMEDGFKEDSPMEFETDLQTEKALAWMDAQAADATAPFFMYMAYTNPHDDGDGDSIPYKLADKLLAPGSYGTMKANKWANIKNLDDSVRDIWSRIRSLGIEDNTIIIFTSDNGAALGRAPVNDPYRGFKVTNLEGGIHVPFTWYQVGGPAQGTHIDYPAGLEDILPSLYEGVLGRAVTWPIDGDNLYPLLTGDTLPERDMMIGAWQERGMWAARRGKWKLINNEDEDVNDGPATPVLAESLKLYDLDADPGETTDLSSSNASLVNELKAFVASQVVGESNRTSSNQSRPGGWNVDPPYWGHPGFYYNSQYYFSKPRGQ